MCNRVNRQLDFSARPPICKVTVSDESFWWEVTIPAPPNYQDFVPIERIDFFANVKEQCDTFFFSY